MIRNYILDVSYENEPYCVGCESVEQEYSDELGARYIFEFPNGRKATVIKFHGSYGWDNDLWEVGIWKDENIDEIGNLTDEEVNVILQKVCNGEL